MALIKTYVEEKTGTPVTYWRITQITAKRIQSSNIDIELILDGYFSKDAFLSNKVSILTKTINIVTPNTVIIPNLDILEYFYTTITQLNVGFEDAVKD